MSDLDGLVRTRARRANAGSRLKQLIELEESASGIKQALLSEDDENVQLLFQEDADDAEFEEEEESEQEEGSDEERDEEAEGAQEEEDEILDPKKEAAQLQEEEEEDQAVNSDDVLSDSDLSVSENDDSEGERELEKEERAKKRKSRHKTIIPAIKRPKVVTQKKQPSKKPDFSSDAFMYSERRSSSRKSAVQNKQALLEKLKQDETRRAALSPVIRVKERDLTQEERLAQALETEKANTISLHAFLEQEIVKKERQKMMFQQRRPKLRNVVRLSSFASFVSPVDEIEDARHLQDLFDRKRRGRRRKPLHEDPDIKRPGDVDKELPYYKKEMAEMKRLEEEKLEEKRKLEEARAEKRHQLDLKRKERRLRLEAERQERKRIKEERLKEFEDVDITNPKFSADYQALQDEIKNLETPLPEEEDEESQSHIDVDRQEDSNKEGTIESEGEDKSSPKTQPEETTAPVLDVKSSDEKDPEDTNRQSEEASPEVVEIKTENDQRNKESDNAKNEDDMDIDSAPQDVEKEEGEQASLKADEDKSAKESPNATPADQNEDKAEYGSLPQSNKDTSATPADSVRATPEQTLDTEKGTEALDTEGKPSDADSGQKEGLVENDEKVKVEKKVTFEEGVDSKDKDEDPVPLKEENDEDEVEEEDYVAQYYRPGPDGFVYEGPVQYVARNMVYLIDFDEEERTWRLPESTIKSALFGEGSLMGASRRFKDVETVLRSTTRNENPYAAPKEEKEDDLYQAVTDITEDNAMFDDLKRLHKLGARVEDEEEEEEEHKEEENVVHIKTEAPTGLYLPNGNKKICLISGKEVRYFDPTTGVPYDSVEDYKVIKSIEAGAIPWYSIPKDQNTYGAAEIYLNRREGTRHAKGVPEGFDGF